MDRFTSGKETSKFEQIVPTDVRETMHGVTNAFDEFKRGYNQDKEAHNEQHLQELYEFDSKIKEVKDISDQYFAEMNIRTLFVLLPFAMLLESVLKNPLVRFINLFTKWYQYDKATKTIRLNQAPRMKTIIGIESDSFNLTEWIKANKEPDRY